MTAGRRALVVAAALLLPACGAMDWMDDPRSHQARQLATLSWVATLAFAAVCLVVWLLIGYVVARARRGTLAERGTVDSRDGMGWIYLWGLVIPGVLFAAALIASITMMFAASEHMHGEHQAPAITITGHQWWWEVHYHGPTPADGFVTANEIHIPVGRDVLVRLRSADVIHSFWVPKLSGKVDLVPARDNHIMLHADTPGVYEGQCAEFCGAEHAMMRIVVVAEPEAEYQAWRFVQHAPAVLPRHEPEVRGLEVFEQKACSLCHTIRGTEAHGTVGPDLTHVGGRLMIAANTYPNDRAHLQAWITRPHSLKPQMRMPNLFDITGEDLNALAIFLGSLR